MCCWSRQLDGEEPPTLTSEWALAKQYKTKQKKILWKRISRFDYINLRMDSFFMKLTVIRAIKHTCEEKYSHISMEMKFWLRKWKYWYNSSRENDIRTDYIKSIMDNVTTDACNLVQSAGTRRYRETIEDIAMKMKEAGTYYLEG
jgi:hypothetical protein